MFLLCVLALIVAALASLSSMTAIALFARQQRSAASRSGKIIPMHHPAVRGGA